ncbi:MAG: CopD family protein [Proteobacteria bacterium]|nr:CopD family protein [Pseudomonadota bacterium]
MINYYLWLKGLHVAFMVTWFAGLFYLPRLFIYHARAGDAASRDRFSIMETRLFIIMTIGAVLTTVFGFLMLNVYQALFDMRWFQLKLLLLAGVVIYHYRCHCWIATLRRQNQVQDDKWLRWFNEIPVVFLLGIILLAIVKPF